MFGSLTIFIQMSQINYKISHKMLHFSTNRLKSNWLSPIFRAMLMNICISHNPKILHIYCHALFFEPLGPIADIYLHQMKGEERRLSRLPLQHEILQNKHQNENVGKLTEYIPFLLNMMMMMMMQILDFIWMTDL